MIQMGASPRPEIVPRPSHLRALAARALRAMADKVQPVTAESLIVRTEPYGYHLDDVIHR